MNDIRAVELVQHFLRRHDNLSGTHSVLTVTKLSVDVCIEFSTISKLSHKKLCQRPQADTILSRNLGRVLEASVEGKIQCNLNRCQNFLQPTSTWFRESIFSWDFHSFALISKQYSLSWKSGSLQWCATIFTNLHICLFIYFLMECLLC